MRTFLKLLIWLALIAGAVYYYFYHFLPSSSSESVEQTTAQGGGQTAQRSNGNSANGGRSGPRGPIGPNSPFQMNTLVKVTHAQRQSIQEVVTSLGTVIPSQTVTVRSQVDGVLQSLHFEEGQLVNQGDVLAKIDPRHYQAALDQAKGSLAQNQAKLNNARQDLKRYQTLFKQDSIARQEVDSQQALVREYEGAQLNLQAAVEQAQVNLGYTTIVAPISGRLGLRNLDVGNLMSSSSTDGLVVITQTQPIDVSFSIAENYISKVANAFYTGQSLSVNILSKDRQSFIAQGQLVSMDNQVDTSTGSVKLKARFDNKDYQLFPNQFVNAQIILSQLRDVLVLSTDAIQYGQEGAFVYVVQDDNTIKAQAISLGIVDSGMTQVLSGITDTDKIVIEGLDRLRNGAKVEIVQ